MHPPFAAPNLMGPYHPQYSQPTTNPVPFHAPVLTTCMIPATKKVHIITLILLHDANQYLDSNKGRNQDGIVFASFGALLKNKGFVYITQLTSDFVSLKDLQVSCMLMEYIDNWEC
jgi:hypothetical protein